MRIFLYTLQGMEMFNTTAWDNSIWHKVSIIGFFVILGIFIFLNVSKKIQNSKVFKTNEIKVKNPLSQFDDFYKAASEYQLTKEEIRYLRNVLNSGRRGGADAEEILKNPAELDAIFKMTYGSLAREAESSKKAETEAAMLLGIRNTIEYFNKNKKLRAYKNLSPRASTRKEFTAQCKCCIVEEVKIKQNGKTVKKLVLTDKKFDAAFINISAGGCAMSPRSPVKAGLSVKIEFSIKRNNLAVLGTILRVNKSPEGTVIHVRFIKVPQRSLNHINAYVFAYE